MKGEGQRTYSRRRFLSTVGVGAGAVALNPGSVVAAPRRAHGHGQSFLRPENFGRIFRLRPFAEQSPKVEAALRELGKPGGLLDAADKLSAGPQALIVDPALSANNPNNPDHTAGTTFFGQFLDHDMTFDASSTLARAAVPEATSNFRTPALDLDSVYGAGPVAQQELYDPVDHIKLKIESGGLFEDLPRREDGTAIVGDPRNDENLIISGLHCAFILFHNNAVDHVRAQGRLRRSDGGVRGGPQAHHLALPVDARPRVPAADRRPGAGRRRASPRRPLLQAGARRGLHPRRLPDRHLPDGAQHGAALVPRQPRRRRRAAVLRLRLRSLAGGQGRPRRSPGREPRAAAVRRLADLLRLRRRRGQAEQEDRHQDLHAALRPSAGCDRQSRSSDGTARSATCSATSRGSFRPGRASPAPWESPRSPPQTSRSSRRSTSASSAARRSGTTSSRRRNSSRTDFTSALSAAVSSPRSSSASCDPTRPPSSPAQPTWQPTLPAKNGTFRMTDFLTFAGVDPHSRGQ